MTRPSRKVEWLVWGGLLLVITTLLLLFFLREVKARGAPVETLPVLAQVGDFSLTNQDARVVTLADLRGHVWVGDIIFTRCPGPCLKMSRQMKELQQALPAASQAKLVSLTTDPAFDSPAILKAYAERFAADPARWLFLTRTKKQIAAFAIGSLKLTAVEKRPE